MPALRPTALRHAVPALLALMLVAAHPTAALAGSNPSPAPRAATSLSGPAGAAALRSQADRLTTDLAAQSDRLTATRDTARRALEERQRADRAADDADRAAAESVRVLAVARYRVALAKQSLDGFAGALYRRGPQQQGISYLAAALVTAHPGNLLHDVEVAQQVGEGRAGAYTRFQEAAAAQRAAARRQQQASATARTLRAQALAAQTAAEAAVAAQARLVDLRAREVALAVDAATLAERREALLARAEAIAGERARAGIPASALAGALVPRPTGTCQGGALAGYANGTLPESALCPLWGTAGQVLRADAAAAFNDLSRHYAEQQGAPLCVTDSYRSLPEQVAVRAAKPTLAAVPGTSNHGWGVAADLCGGAERFDGALHAWLVENAAAFGWFLPSWAQPGGSKPEPWHWEFAG